MRLRFVYFVSGGGFVKIGVSDSPSSRLLGIQTGNPWPLEIVGMIVGGTGVETALHKRFANYRVSGEWFHLAAEVRQFIADFAAPNIDLERHISDLNIRIHKLERATKNKLNPEQLVQINAD
jgi:hypothetical protein